MKLHQNIKLFTDAVRVTAQRMNIPPEFVEKDYWVTYALFTIFNNEIGKDTVFKGGTALSKCYNMIERFSEDIDLVVLRREGETDSKLKSKLKAVSTVVETVLPEVTIEGITHKMGMNRKTAHSYNKEFKGDYGQVRDIIILESTCLGYYEPYTTKNIVSFVGQMMLDNKQSDIAQENGLLPFELLALEPIRTICEKIMSLVRFSYGENPMDDLKKKIRHTYDLHQLIKQDEFFKFFQSTAFDEMLLKVANDDVASFRNNNKWLNYHPSEALIFKDLENVWNELKTIYNGDFKNLVYGELPEEEVILKTLKMIRDRMVSVQWLIVNEMRENIVKNKSFSFAVRIVKHYQFLCEQKKEFVLSKQLLRSGTSIGAMVREAEHAETKNDFKHKMGIAQKEINETIYWLELLKETDYLTQEQFESINNDAVEIIKLIASILKSTKANVNN